LHNSAIVPLWSQQANDRCTKEDFVNTISKGTEKAILEIFVLKMGGPDSFAQRIAALNRQAAVTPWEDTLALIDPGRKEMTDEQELQLLKDLGLLRITRDHAEEFAKQYGAKTNLKKPCIKFPHGVPDNEECNDSHTYFNRGKGAHGFLTSYPGDHRRYLLAAVVPPKVPE